MSVDYLSQPMAVLAEIRRVLTPGLTLTLALTLTTHPHHSPLNLYPNPNLFRDRQDADDKNRQTLVFAEMCELHTTYYLLLTIHYLLPTTAYLPLPTYH